jgi:hypothetical protein
VGGQQNSQPYQRIELQKPVDRPPPQLPPTLTQGAHHAKPDKEKKKEDLNNPAGSNDF